MTFWGIYWKNCSSSRKNGYLKRNFTRNKLPNFQKKKKEKKKDKIFLGGKEKTKEIVLIVKCGNC